MVSMEQNGSRDILFYFAFTHLPSALGQVSKDFYDLAVKVNANQNMDPREKAVALRKLLEAKDAAVRAALT